MEIALSGTCFMMTVRGDTHLLEIRPRCVNCLV